MVRISGRDAIAIADRILTRDASWKPWTAVLAKLTGPAGDIVDQVVATYYAAPRSYTTEDVVEISCHGAPVVLRYCLQRAVEAGARIANPGEFTLRAYVNGRMDLPQAEAVRDLIEATTLYQARVAAQQVDGSISRRMAPLKAQLVELIALLEAGIDFAEDDISVAPDREILGRLQPIARGIEAMARSFEFGKLIHEGFTLAIVGRPNVGKSSLFNRLLQQERSIVTDIPGTTRDTVSESAAIEGIPVRLVDTAGIRTSNDVVERLGIERSYQSMTDADLTIVVIDASTPLTGEDESLIERARKQGRALVVANKVDQPVVATGDGLRVSARTGEGIGELRAAVMDAIAPGGHGAEESYITSLRHEQLLRESLRFLAKAASAVHNRIPHEMLLLDLYGALRPLDAITGATTADDILNRIFSTFCIGK